MGGLLALGYHLFSRLAYVAGVGGMLRRQEREQWFTRDAGVEAGYRRFRRIASIIMNNDGISFVVLALATRHTLVLDLPRAAVIGSGVVLALVGIGVKVWAARRLGSLAYYWYDFFAPDVSIEVNPPGPYRYLKNPMYTVGYLQTYGLALILGSWPALLMSAFDQAAILLFYRVVEKPHFARLIRRAAG